LSISDELITALTIFFLSLIDPFVITDDFAAMSNVSSNVPSFISDAREGMNLYQRTNNRR
jgi:hypothetical protein